MQTSVQQLLDSFESMPETERHQVAVEIIRRTLGLELPPLSDEELTLNAEQLFLELDKLEAANDRA